MKSHPRINDFLRQYTKNSLINTVTRGPPPCLCSFSSLPEHNYHDFDSTCDEISH